MDKLRKALSGQDSRDNDSSTGILPVSKYFSNFVIICEINCIVLYYLYNNVDYIILMFILLTLLKCNFTFFDNI